MRHVVIASEFPPNNLGGVSRFMQALANCSSEVNLVQVIAIDKNSRHDYVVNSNKFETIFFGAQGLSIRHPRSSLEKVKSKIATYVLKLNLGPDDVLEFNDTEGIASKAIEMIYSNRLRPKLICSTTNPTFLTSMADCRPSILSSINVPSERLCLDLADLIIAPSKSAFSELRKVIPASKEVIVLPPPFLFEPFENDEAEVFRDIDVLFFGRQQTLKGFKEFVELSKHLKNRIESGELTVGILGAEHVVFPEGLPSRTYLEKALGSTMNKIQLFGHVSDVRPVLTRCRVVLIPSRIDWAPNSVVESLLLGANVVTTRDTGAAEMSDYVENGQTSTFLFNSTDVLQLISATEDALKGKNNKKKPRIGNYSVFLERQQVYTTKLDRDGTDFATFAFQAKEHANISMQSRFLRSFQTISTIRFFWRMIPRSLQSKILSTLLKIPK